jgi:hypothetical protein
MDDQINLNGIYFCFYAPSCNGIPLNFNKTVANGIDCLYLPTISIVDGCFTKIPVYSTNLSFLQKKVTHSIDTHTQLICKKKHSNYEVLK